MESNQPAEALPELIAERYRVEGLLGRGGMAAVYQVTDLVEARVVALKRLLQRDAANLHVEQLFELEYHTLSQLAHPGIVEVYDYRTDGQGDFYTMELLTGGDLRKRAPIGWSELCRRLCDVGSALALLHSRRFVHRDLTPVNIRCMPDGRTKLLDFGSMAHFGRAKHVVGTPPFVAPEALNGEWLDAQTDLYALGATAYYALTGRHAYPARTLAELPDLWRSPPPAPSQLAPGVPAALDELIMRLLALQPGARPPSAAEVIERLSAIGGFELREALVVGEAYLTKPTLVGREDLLAAMARNLEQLAAGHGTAVLVSGAAGTGRSRLLDVCALEAKLSGALVLRTNAQDSAATRWAAAAELLQQLSQELPELSASLMARHGSSLAWMLTSSAPEGPVERAEIQTALQGLLLELTVQRPVAIVVDDIQRIDEPTAALLALLAHGARDHRVLVIGATSGQARDGQVDRALQLMAEVAEAWSLENLTAEQTDQLVVSLFGDVPNVHLLADRIFGATDGNPQLVMRVTRHLVRVGVCSYAAGTWLLPASLSNELLRTASRESIDPGLSTTALELARMLALSGLSTLSLGECLQLSAHGNLKQLHADLSALAAVGIVRMDGDAIGLSRPSWEALLLADLAPHALRPLHLRVAAALEHRPSARFRMIQHLLQGGAMEQSLDLLLADIRTNRPTRIADPGRSFEFLQSLPRDWPETYHALIEACRRLGRPLREQLELQIELLAYATLAALTERESVLALAKRLSYDCGLDLIAERQARAAPSDVLAQALVAAQQRHDQTPERERGLPLLEALTALAQLTIQAMAMAGRALDLSLLRALPSLAPLAPLSTALAVVQKNLESSIAMLAGQGLGAREPYLEIVRRLDEPDGAGLGNTHRVHMRSAVLWAIGSIEADLGRPCALERAAAIESNPLFSLSALQLRSMYMLVRGDYASAESYRKRAELLQIQNCPPQMFQGAQLLRFTSNYAAIGDLLQLKQCVKEVEALASQHADWRPVAHYARGVYQALRGDQVQAQAELEAGLALMSVGHHVNWATCAGALLWTLTRQARYSEAVERGRTWLASADEQPLPVTVHQLLIPMALAEAHLGELDAGLAHIGQVIELLSAELGGGVLLGQAFEVAAEIALLRGDADGFDRALSACDAQYRRGRHAALQARVERLQNRGRAAGVAVTHGPSRLAEQGLHVEDVQTIVSTLLGSARGSVERAERALRAIADASHCSAGALYLIKSSGPTLVAEFGDSLESQDVAATVKRLLNEANEAEAVTQSTVSGDLASQTSDKEPTRLTPMLLRHVTEAGTHVSGVAVLKPETMPVELPIRLLQALSRSLCEAGDVSPRSQP